MIDPENPNRKWCDACGESYPVELFRKQENAPDYSHLPELKDVCARCQTVYKVCTNCRRPFPAVSVYWSAKPNGLLKLASRDRRCVSELNMQAFKKNHEWRKQRLREQYRARQDRKKAAAEQEKR